MSCPRLRSGCRVFATRFCLCRYSLVCGRSCDRAWTVVDRPSEGVSAHWGRNHTTSIMESFRPICGQLPWAMELCLVAKAQIRCTSVTIKVWPALVPITVLQESLIDKVCA